MTPEPSTQPKPDPDAPKLRHLSVEAFLTMAHNPKGLRPGLDKHLDEIQSKGDTDDRTMLRVCFWLLSNIGRSMPWDRVSGIDAKRFNSGSQAVAPAWRECIGAILGVSYEEPEGPDDEEPEEQKLLAAPPEDTDESEEG